MLLNEPNVINKDILTIQRGIIGHGVNCYRVFNKGLALQIRKLYPQVYQAYIAKPEWKLGDVQFVQVSVEPELHIVNMATQYSYGTNRVRTKEEGVRKCLMEVRAFQMSTGLPVYLPYMLGSGLGGGPTMKSKMITWSMVYELIEEIVPNAILCVKPQTAD